MLIRRTEKIVNQKVPTWVDGPSLKHVEEIKRITWWILCLPVARFDYVVTKYR